MVVDGNWSECDNGELRIPISDCSKDRCTVVITCRL